MKTSTIDPLTSDDVGTLVAAGVAAPSADNRHVIAFEPRGSSLRLVVDHLVLAGAAPHRIAFIELALGAVIENVVLAAGGMGRIAAVTLNPGWRDDGMVANIALGPAALDVDPNGKLLCAAIFERCTNRRLFERGRAASSTVLLSLAHAAASAARIRVHWLDSAGLRRRALSLMFRAERERFRNRRLHAELFEAVRFDVGWKGKAEIGLPPVALEIEPPFRSLFGALSVWPVQRGLNCLGAAHLLGLRAAWLPAWSAPHLALLSLPQGGEGARIDAGRGLQRFWLEATRQSLAVQPFGASIALALQTREEPWAPAVTCARIRGDLRSLADGREPVMLLRLGYAAPPSGRAGRPDSRAFVIRA